MAAATKRSQPEWTSPNGSVQQLRLYNSLTRKKELFAPADGNQVKWYICGPTVYDASHMGHARSYITFDIVRRVMQDYFNYRIFHVMNITDVDDKIILRARRNHLFEEYAAKKPAATTVLADVKSAMEPFRVKAAKEEDPAKKEMLEKIVKNVETCTAAVEKSPNDAAAVFSLLEAARDPISQMLDKEHGAEITDHSIFTKLSKFWEEDYMRDMDTLNVLPPDALTRVSEYVPEIVEFVVRIISNGYAYEADGSVYFDVNRFDQNDKHSYAKLVPEAVGNLAALAEGEGELGATQGKRAPQDFALWKKSKPGEPAWPSPWGMGRPGWHIECSAMASDILPGELDIHCGGIDLMFPHHDNEIAQSEAYYGCKQWVHFFLHAGHLEIEGRKMSKSLKNFVTIKEALERHTSRQLRLMFLCHNWINTLDYSENTIATAKHLEKLFGEFFLNVKAVIRETPREYKYGAPERQLAKKIMDAQNAVHEALCDSIDTATALKVLRDLVGDVNMYLADPARAPSAALLRKAGEYVTRILKIFGVIPDNSGMGFPTGDGSVHNAEELIMPYVEALSNFRDSVRTAALARTPKDTEMLDLAGHLRDEVLPALGVRVEDRQGEKAVVKLVDKEELLRERERERAEKEERERKKQEEKRRKEELERKKLEAAKVPPSEMFKIRTTETGAPMYSKFDERGVPTHDAEGEELTKGAKKKAEKEYEAQRKAHEKYLSSLQGGQ